MGNLIAIIAGGALGAMLRHQVSGALERASGQIPLGTMAVNLIGSFLIGFAYAWMGKRGMSTAMRLFVITGLLGSLTTFSTYAMEVTQLLEAGEMMAAFSELMIHNFLGIGLAIAGYALGQKFLA